MTTRCNICKLYARESELEATTKSGFMRHVRGAGCRKGEHLLVVAEAPRPKKVVVETRLGHMIHTGPINGLSAALLRAGVVKIQPRA